MAGLGRAMLTSWVLASLTACSFQDFDYLSADFGSEGGGGNGGNATNACSDQVDGESCDDGDVCTLSSLCSGGMCEGSGETGCVVADSFQEFSTAAQGVEGWHYGYWAAGLDTDADYDPDTDFQQLQACGDNVWSTSCVARDDPAFSWTQIMAALQHAAIAPHLQLPVRRWVSDVSGPATVALDHHHANPGEGDGTRAILRIDGVQVWVNEIAGDDALGVQTAVDVDLRVGTRVELMLHPRVSEAQDMTHFSIVLTDR